MKILPVPSDGPSARCVLSLALVLLAFPAAGISGQPIRGLFHNEDETDFFWNCRVEEGRAGELIDRYVDGMAAAGVGVFLCNTNARRTNYSSDVWESYWDGYDPAGPDDQPFLAPIPKGEVRAFRNGIDNMLAVHRAGIDYPARVIGRCRQDRMSPWISLRMNDCHYNDIPEHPFHGTFWKKNPRLRRQNCSGYFATCLDYANGEVRDFFRALIAESLDRYDIDGLELDFLREPYLFSAGKEAEGAAVLTAWIGEVRRLASASAAKRKHPVLLGVRVPSRPEAAKALGLEAIEWAKAGLIDVLVVAPRWATLEFDMPLERWRELLGASPVTLAGGLEVRYQPSPGAPAAIVSPELAAGAAVSVLSGGADAVYLFNYFQSGNVGWTRPVYLKTLKAMASLASLEELPRTVAVTYRDITAPNENYRPPLPAAGKEVQFVLRLGSIADGRRPCTVRIGCAPATGPAPGVFAGDRPCGAPREDATREGIRWLSFGVPPESLPATGTCRIKIVSGDGSAVTIERIEMSLE